MVYRRAYVPRRRPMYRRRRTYGGRGRGMTVKSVRRIANSVIHKSAETKYVDYGFNTIAGGDDFSSVSYGGSADVAYLFQDISQGAAESNRVGDQIHAIGIKYDYIMQPGDDTNWIRFLFVSPKYPDINHQYSGKADLIQSLFSFVASAPQQWAAPVDTSRFHVLSDRRFFLRTSDYYNGSGTSSQSLDRRYHGYVKLNRKIKFDLEEVCINDVMFVAISDSGAIPHPGFIAGYMKIYFKDF